MSRYVTEIEPHLQSRSYRWLVTGAAGFIGSNLAHRLLELNQDVVGLDDMSTGQQKNIDELNRMYSAKGNWRFAVGDIRNPESCDRACSNIDFVLHQAAIGSVPRSIEDPLLSHSANVDGFIKVLYAAKKNGVKKFVYASSSSVYGDHPGLPKVEDKVGELLSPYAATKKIDEIYAKVFARCYDMQIMGLRYFNVFGPRQSPSGPYAAVIPLWIQSLIDGEPVYINGDGSYSRDFCYIENVIQANLLATFADKKFSGEVYNIAYGDRTDLKQLYAYIRESLLGLNPQLQIQDAVYREFRDGDIPHSHADVTKAIRDLGYEPVIAVKTGLTQTIQFYLDESKKV